MAEPIHLLVDSTGLELCGPGEWLFEKHGAKRRRSWRALHLWMIAGLLPVGVAVRRARHCANCPS
ncbi:Transposase [Azospirillum endophyticum]